jgi:hypothetical protein
MASDVDICNMALSHIGSEAIIASIAPADGSVEAGYCARFYPIALGILLEKHPWSFAKTRQALSLLDNPSKTWGFAYGLPGNCLKPKRVLQATTLTGLGFRDFSRSISADEYQVFDEAGSANFTIETDQATGQKILLTNEPEAVLLYIRRVEDTASFTWAFTWALSFMVAGFIAGPIIKGQPGASTGQLLHKSVMDPGGLADQAAMLDADGSKDAVEHVPAHIRVR